MSEELPVLDFHRHALFLDFDGTLAPIVPRPEQAAPSERTRAAVERLHRRLGGALALLSGRDLADLDLRVAPLRVAAAGSHGVVRRDASGALVSDPDAAQAIAEATERLEAFARTLGLLVERKTGAVTVHYRSRPEAADASRAAVADIVEGSPGLRAIHGNMVSEIAIGSANKGDALAAFMDEPPFAGRVPLVAGDDTTDEDAFEAASRLGGGAIKIGPGPTAAAARVPAIEDFLRWLHEAAER